MKPNFSKTDDLLPAIIQDAATLQILMLGYMNEEAYEKTLMEQKVTFFSRSKNRLWTKGETSGNFLVVEHVYTDCDQDALVVLVRPTGPVCHRGTLSCFALPTSKGFVYKLEQVIEQRIDHNTEASYTNALYRKGINKVAQKLGEEAVELVIESKDNNLSLFKAEAADLLYHYLVLLKAKGCRLADIEDVLRAREK